MLLNPTFPHRAACTILLFATLANQLPAQPETNEPGNTRQPIPLDGIPDELPPLIKAGRVEVVYEFDLEFVKASRGWADFHWDIQRKFEFNSSRKAREFSITVTKVDFEIQLTHLIRIPATFRSPKIWTSELLRHEFDHVAISLDSRPRLLIEHLMRNLPVIKHSLGKGESGSTELAVKIINTHLDQRINAVRAVMKFNNQVADRISQHGTIPVPKRREFFESLYSKENLADSKFPFMDESLPLLESREYQEAPRPFLQLDPTSPWPRETGERNDR